MDKVKMALGSRTVWSAVVMFLVAGVSAVQDVIPDGYVTVIQAVLTALTVYFRVNPQQPK